MSYQLREYQTKAVEALRAAVRAGKKSLVLQAPTGSGKTLIAASIIEGAVEKGKFCLFLAPRRELIYQCSEKLDAYGIRHGLIMAGEMTDSMAQVQVACIPTLHARAMRAKRIALPVADLVIFDEAHLSLAPTFMAIAESYKNEGAVLIGLTATPARGDGRGLGELYDEIVPTESVTGLVDGGYLVPQIYYSPSVPDLAGVKIVRGDYHEGQLEKRMDQPKLIGDIVTNWMRLASERQTVVFASGVQHSIHLRDEFRRAGVAAEHLDGKTPLEERKDILSRVNSGEVQVLCNCMVCCYGWDAPSVSCCVLARPTKSIVMYLQMGGRVMRIFPGKADMLFLDHSGVVHDLGYLDEEQPWSLDGDEKLQERKQAAPKKPKPITCPACKHNFKCASQCPMCGWKPSEKEGKYALTVEGDLYEVERATGKQKTKVYTVEDKQRWYSELWAAKKPSYKDGWVAFKYREKFGVWPRSLKREAAEPSREVLSWLRSRNIAQAKAKEKTNDVQRRDTGAVAPATPAAGDQPRVSEEHARPVPPVRGEGPLQVGQQGGERVLDLWPVRGGDGGVSGVSGEPVGRQGSVQGSPEGNGRDGGQEVEGEGTERPMEKTMGRIGADGGKRPSGSVFDPPPGISDEHAAVLERLSSILG